MEAKSKRLRGWQLEKEKTLGEAGDDQARSTGCEKNSVLATKLLSLWSMGSLSAVAIQELAHLAMLDGAQHPELAALAKAGNYGKVPGNVHRDVLTHFCKGLELAQSIQVEVACLDPKTSVKENVQADIFLPHLMFWSLAMQYADQWSNCFCIMPWVFLESHRTTQ